MLGADSFRVNAGDPVELSASGMNLLADMANKFREDRYKGTEPPNTKAFGQSQWIARVVNATGRPLEAGSIVQIGAFPWGSGAYPGGWIAKNQWTEINDQSMVLGKAPVSASRMHAVLLEKCREGGTAEACVGGYCFARVEFLGPVGGAGLADPTTISEWADIIPGETGRLKMGGSGAFRVVEIFYGAGDDQLNSANNSPIAPCLVELQRPGNLSPVYRCFSQTTPRLFSNGMQRLVGSIYLPPHNGSYLVTAEVFGQLSAAQNQLPVTFTIGRSIGSGGLPNALAKIISNTGPALLEFSTTLSWWFDVYTPPFGPGTNVTGYQFDVFARLSSPIVNATGNIGVANLSAVKHGPVVQSCSRIPPEPPVFLGPFNRSAYTPAVPFSFDVSVSDEATPPASLAVTVDTAAQNASVGLPAANVSIATISGQPSQRRVTITVPNVGTPPSTVGVFLTVTDSDAEFSNGTYYVSKQGTVPPTFARSPSNSGSIVLSANESASLSWTITDADTPSGPFTFSSLTPLQFPFPANTYTTSSYATISLTPDDASWKTGTATITCTANSPISPGIIVGWSFTVTDPNGNTCSGNFGFYLKA